MMQFLKPRYNSPELKTKIFLTRFENMKDGPLKFFQCISDFYQTKQITSFDIKNSAVDKYHFRKGKNNK